MRKRLRSLLAAAALVLLLPMSTQAMTMGQNPGTGTTKDQPFAKGTAGSTSFRIPGLVRLKDGSLLATADARWNTSYDGGGLDTIVSRSEDEGKNWTWSFANYLGDNGNQYSGGYNVPQGTRGSTCFIDPSLAVKEEEDGTETIYLLADIYPYGVALNGIGNLWPSKETGFDANGRLLLSTDAYGTEQVGNNVSYTYGYYLNTETGQIHRVQDDAVQEGYQVDAHFNITGNGVDTNLFFADSPFKVQRTSYLYLVTSRDGGRSWSDPVLLPLKKNTERAYLAAPARGIVTERGEIVYPCYSYDGSANTQRMSFIYSKDGIHWERSTDAPVAGSVGWHSESAAVELSDGRLRFFFRTETSRLTYIDYMPGTDGAADGSWKAAPVVESSIPTNSNCQISVLKYSRTSEGKEVLLAACPTGSGENGSNQSAASARLNGKIFVGVINEDEGRTISWNNDAKIHVTSNENNFMYSSMVELSDGSIGILYEFREAGWGYGEGKYYEMRYETYEVEHMEFDPVIAPQLTLDTSGISLQDKEYDGRPLTYTGEAVAAWSDGSSYTGEIQYQWLQGEEVLLTAPAAAGTYQLRVSVSAEDADVQTQILEASILPKSILVWAEDAVRYYGQENPELTFDYGDGLAEGETAEVLGIILETDAEVTSLPGEYEIRMTADSSNYQPEVRNGVLQIQKAIPFLKETPTASAVREGEALSASVLTGMVVYGNGAGGSGTEAGNALEVAGSFSWEDPAQIPETDGAGAYGWIFTPDDTTCYESIRGTVSVTVMEPELPWIFEDIPQIPGDWKYDNIKTVYERGLMADVGGSKRFEPNQTLTRGMLATILYRMAGSPVTAYQQIFPDVPEGKWFSQAIVWAAEHDIVDGYTTGSFGTNDPVTRQQIAKMLYLYGEVQGYERSGRADLDSFTDQDQVSSWAVEYIRWAVDAGMINGKPNPDGSYRLAPREDATRAECAKMISLFLEKYDPR